MPVFVQRDAIGKIIAVYANLQPGFAEEAKDSADPDVTAFLATIEKCGSP